MESRMEVDDQSPKTTHSAKEDIRNKRDIPKASIEDDPEMDRDGEDEVEEVDAFGEKSRRGRSVALHMLMADGTLEPSDGSMSVEYLGTRFVGDLLPDGKIRWQETKEIFSSPSAWASHCKRLLNPDKKFGCGWASIKYNGRKLDSIKAMWLEKHNKSHDEGKFDFKQPNNGNADEGRSQQIKELQSRAAKSCVESASAGLADAVCNNGIKRPDEGRRPVVKHSSLGNRCSDQKLSSSTACGSECNTLVECTPFCALGKIQPFTLTITTNCLILMDFHCHLTTSEVVGYLAGSWDVNSHNLSIQHAFPCRCRLGDKENAPFVEEEIRQNLEKRQLLLVGWYHSHPAASVHPTLRDIDCQMDYQIKLKGDSDACYTPCVGVICSPYDKDCYSLESSIQAYWVMPPPENKPQEYGKPMLMTFSLIQESFLSPGVIQEMDKLMEYYKQAPDLIDFNSTWKEDVTYMEKLKKSLSQKAPIDQMEKSIDELIQSLLKITSGANKRDIPEVST